MTEPTTEPRPLLELARFDRLVRLRAQGDRYAVTIIKPRERPVTFDNLNADDALTALCVAMNEEL